MPLTAGTKLGPYEIIEPLGAGGMGEVYRASDPRLDREVAIKVLPASLASDPTRVWRLEQEAQATGRLNHPSILAIYDVGRIPEGLPGERARRFSSPSSSKAIRCATTCGASPYRPPIP